MPGSSTAPSPTSPRRCAGTAHRSTSSPRTPRSSACGSWAVCEVSMSMVDVAGQYGPGDGPRVEVGLVYQAPLRHYRDPRNPAVLPPPLAWRRFAAVLTGLEPGDPLPDTGHVYLLGGGED